VPEIECIARDVTNRKKQQQLEADRNRVLELVAHRSPLEQILPVVENLVDRQIPNACCSIIAVSPRLGGDGLLTSQQPHQAEPEPDLDAFEGRDGSNHLEIRASDDSLLGWLWYARGNSVSLEPRKQLVFDTAVNLAAVAIEYDLLNRKLIHQSQHDALTGLPNRLLYQDRLAQALLRARRHSELLAVIYLDLDHFKYVNDQMGHDAGDILLVEVSRRLRAQLRESDSVARMGGDEFTLVFPELKSREDAGRIAAKLVESLRKPFLIRGIEVFTSASVGISMYPEDSEDSSMLEIRADMAMYWAKSLGKSRYEFFKDMPAQGSPFRPVEIR
jgi:diguanylate cyclase (GGDEF)-like protein